MRHEPLAAAPHHEERERMQIYVDMDGVLADFDRQYETVFGTHADKRLDNVDWKAVRKVADFYLHIPPMLDMPQLWRHIGPHRPIVLTGVPLDVPEAPENKRAWVRKHLGREVKVICCRSREKSRYAKAGDILIDDWEKYRALWLAKGGRWVTHRSAADTIATLSEIGI